MTFTHKFTDGTTQTMTMKLTYDKANNSYGYEISDADLNKMLTAMREQGRVDVGYGDISNEKTLLDTYTGGLNVLTGLSSDALRAMSDQDAKDAIKKGLNEGPLGLVSSAVMASDQYINGTIDAGTFTTTMGNLQTGMSKAEHTISTVYADLGNKSSILDTTKKRLDALEDSLETQYSDLLGADPYEAIMEMYSYQYSYSAALKVGANLLQSSLFDFLS